MIKEHGEGSIDEFFSSVRRACVFLERFMSLSRRIYTKKKKKIGGVWGKKIGLP